VRVVRPWPRFPREAVAAPSLAVFKARLDGALSTLLWWKGSLPMAGGWDWVIYKGPSDPNHSVTLYYNSTMKFVLKNAMLCICFILIDWTYRKLVKCS